MATSGNYIQHQQVGDIASEKVAGSLNSLSMVMTNLFKPSTVDQQSNNSHNMHENPITKSDLYFDVKSNPETRSDW